jgi:hypothetical protein
MTERGLMQGLELRYVRGRTLKALLFDILHPDRGKGYE